MRNKKKKSEIRFEFDYVQGLTQGFFKHVLANDAMKDPEYILYAACELLDEFNGQENFFAAFVQCALREGMIKPVHLDKLFLAFETESSDPAATEYIKHILQQAHDAVIK